MRTRRHRRDAQAENHTAGIELMSLNVLSNQSLRNQNVIIYENHYVAMRHGKAQVSRGSRTCVYLTNTLQSKPWRSLARIRNGGCFNSRTIIDHHDFNFNQALEIASQKSVQYQPEGFSAIVRWDNHANAVHILVRDNYW